MARELHTLTAGLPGVDVACLPAALHNRPERIPGAVAAKLEELGDSYRSVFVAYADCGTGGTLDRLLASRGIARLPGAHCYEVYAGATAFARLHDEEPGTFYLTDFLVRNFEGLVWRGLGLDRHPELLPLYFGHYRRLVYLQQSDDPTLVETARRAANRLGLAFQLVPTGYDGLVGAVGGFLADATAGR
ncbi:MAG: hypothetical protein C4344_05920 [Acidimicrobiia bacterium]